MKQSNCDETDKIPSGETTRLKAIGSDAVLSGDKFFRQGGRRRRLAASGSLESLLVFTSGDDRRMPDRRVQHLVPTHKATVGRPCWVSGISHRAASFSREATAYLCIVEPGSRVDRDMVGLPPGRRWMRRAGGTSSGNIRRCSGSRRHSPTCRCDGFSQSEGGSDGGNGFRLGDVTPPLPRFSLVF
ncbi:unnamed protein product [Victoria cruziana]